MNHLVVLDPHAGELEKILSGIKTMVLKEFDPVSPAQPVGPGDSLYFLRKKDDCAVRVKATVIKVLPFINAPDDDLPHILEEMQPKLQLTEDQYNHWSVKNQVLFVEFDSAQKIGAIYVTADKIRNQSGWIAFEEFGLVM